MIEGIQGINAVVFLLLGGVHLFWVFGGLWGTQFAIPSTTTGEPVFQPRKGGTLLVACCLFAAAILNLGFLAIGQWTYFWIGLLFGLRVMGDFKYVGLGKKIKNTPFAQKDATIFIPICIYLSLSHFFLFFWQ